MKSVYFIVIAAAAGTFLIWMAINKRENYGAMKNIKQIPFNDCSRLCEGYRNKCASDFIDADPSWCDRKYEACVAECYYTPYHQLQG